MGKVARARVTAVKVVAAATSRWQWRMVAVGAMAMATDVTAVKAREGVEKKAAATAVVKEVAVKLLW